MLIQILFAAGAVMLTSLIGILFIHKFARTYLEKNLTFLTSFSAGVFLITALTLVFEVFELLPSVTTAGVLIAIGYAFAWLVHFLIPESHHHHDASCEKSARKLLIGDAIHNIGDGIILVPAFLVSPALGIALTISIVIHEALQEISEFFVLRRAGYSTKQALLINFAVSSTILIGVAIGYLVTQTTAIEGVLLALSGGFFLQIVLHDLFPTPATVRTTGSYSKHLLLVIIGAVLMFGLNITLQGHSHGEDHHEEEHVEDHV